MKHTNLHISRSFLFHFILCLIVLSNAQNSLYAQSDQHNNTQNTPHWPQSAAILSSGLMSGVGGPNKGDTKPLIGLNKIHVDNFIKGVVRDIVEVSEQAKVTTTAAAPPPAKNPNKPAVSTTSIPKVVPTTVPTYEFLIIDNLLYVNGKPCTKADAIAYNKKGDIISAELMRYAPDKLPEKKISAEPEFLDDAPEEFSNNPDLVDETSISQYSHIPHSEKVVLADLYDEDIPCFAHYDSNWDIENIHPYRYNLRAMPQTVVFLLSHGIGKDFTIPVQGQVKVTSGFGPRWGRHHNGIDLDLETGDKVYAAFDGKVRIAKYSSSYGNVVVVRHYNGLETTYAHLSRLLVSENQEIKAGTLIALGGNTGRSTGSHLHFEVRYKGHPLNPREMIDFENGKLKYNTFVVDKSYFSSTSPYEDAHNLGGASEARKYGTPEKTWASRSKVAKTTYHTVKKGDTVSEISERYHVSAQKICSLNRISSKTPLKIGRKLRIK